MLALDLGVFHRRSHTVKFKEALVWSLIWISLAGAFAVLVYFWYGRTPMLEFITGYVIELSLSVDNLFVFLVIFRYFKVSGPNQHKVLFWGILGALIMRGVFILAGVGLITRFHWITYVFGALLIYSGVKLFRQEGVSVDPSRNPLLKAFRRIVPVTNDYVEGKFFVRRPGLYATPLFVVLLVVETPAILAITLNAFIVYTSNVFAILGLRSMYFALAGMMDLFQYLHYGLSCVLIFVGSKMLVAHYWEVPTELALGVVVLILASSVVASVLKPKPQPA